MQCSVLRCKELSVLMSLGGGGSSGDEMDVLVVGLASVGKKSTDQTTEGWLTRSRTVVLHWLARREQSADFSGLLMEGGNFEFEIFESP